MTITINGYVVAELEDIERGAPAPDPHDTATTDDLRSYLEAMAGICDKVRRGSERSSALKYTSYEALILAQGRPWIAHRLIDQNTRGPMRYCYANTLALLADYPELRYCEGFAVSATTGIPVFHAWAVDEKDRVWDTTWPDPERNAYYGMTFDIGEVARFLALSVDTFGILASEYILGQPLLRTGELFPNDTFCQARLAELMERRASQTKKRRRR